MPIIGINEMDSAPNWAFKHLGMRLNILWQKKPFLGQISYLSLIYTFGLHTCTQHTDRHSMAFSYNYYQHYLNDLCRCVVTDCVSFHCWDCCCCCCTSKQIILCKTLSGTLVLTITHKYNWKMCTRTKHREHELNKEAQTSHTHKHTYIHVYVNEHQQLSWRQLRATH